MKKQTKRSAFLAMLIALICSLAIALVGCGGGATTESESASESKAESITSVESVMQSESIVESDSAVSEESEESESLEESESEESSTSEKESESEELSQSEEQSESEESSEIEEEPVLSILAPVGTVYPYTDNAKAFLEAGEGADVADYFIKGQKNPQVPVQVKWSFDFEGAQVFIVEYATKADYTDAISVELGATKRSLNVYNLYKGVNYYLRITAIDGMGNVMSQEESEFQTTDLGPRVMNVDGAYNVRDLGGFETSFGKTIVQGLAYRGGMLHFNESGNNGDLTDAGRKTLSEELGITSELDFRSEAESWVIGASSIPGATLTYITAGGYEDIFAGGAKVYREIFRYLANENNYPLYYHCTAGADRTGTVSYILHAFLGVSELECHQDFAFTSFSVYSMRGSHSGKGENADRYWAMVDLLKGYEGDTLQEKTQNYLLSIGVTEAELENIKKIFFGEIEIPNAKTYNPNVANTSTRSAQQMTFASSVGEEETSDYDTYTITKIGVQTNSTASVLNIYSLGGDGLPKDKGDWSAVYTFVEGSGSGLTVNGKAVTSGRIKQPGDLYLPLDNEVNVGDVFMIDGAFVNEEKKLKFVFESCAAKWDGAKWRTVVVKDFSDYTTYEIGSLAFHQVTNTNDNPPIENGYIYFVRADGEQVPVYSKENNFHWDTKFSWEEGGITYNGVATDNAAVKFPSQMFVSIRRTPEIGDVLTIGGNFYYEAVKVRYVITETTFVWDGTAWVVEGSGEPEIPDEPKEYTTYEIGVLGFRQVSNSNGENPIPNAYLYLKRVDGEKIPIFSKENNLHWDTRFSFGSGCITINGEDASAVVKFPSEMFIAFTVSPQVGDVLKVGGEFYSDAINVKYIVEDSYFEWDGTKWADRINYTEYEVGKLSFYQVTKSNDTTPIPNAYLYLRTANGSQLPIFTTENNLHWETKFNWEDGALTINGEDVYATVKFPGEMFIAFKRAPKVGDVLRIAGRFYSETLTARYTIEQSIFVWDGSVWVACVDYTDYETGALTVGDNQTSKSSIALNRADGNGFEINNSNVAFTLLGNSGVGIQLNGVALTTKTIKTNSNELLVTLGVNVKDGDVLRIGGTFYNVNEAVRYIVEESAFVYENGAWAVYTGTGVEVGMGGVYALCEPSTAKGIYFASNDANAQLPLNTWYETFTCVYGVGVILDGVVLDNAKIVSIDNSLYVSLRGENVVVGSEITIGGKFMCEAQGVLYYVDETTLVWDGEAWNVATKTKNKAATSEDLTNPVTMKNVVEIAPLNGAKTYGEKTGCASAVGVTPVASILVAFVAMVVCKKKED